MSERRRWPRFCPTVQVAATFVDSLGRTIAATVVNESAGGLALACEAGADIARGSLISVTCRDVCARGIVWHCRRQEDGTLVFGVEWLDME